MTRMRQLFALALVATLAACSNDGTSPPPPTVDRIVVTPEGSSVTTIGATSQFEAVARTATGATVSGVEFVWSSSNTAVATVDATGQATSMAFGEATISAAAQGKTAGATFSVRDCSETVSLAVGEWIALPVPAPGDCGVILPAGSNGDRYRVAMIRTLADSVWSTDIGNVSLIVNPLGGAAVSAPPASLAAPTASQSTAVRRLLDVPGLVEAARMAERTAQSHMDLRAREAALVRRLGRQNLARPSLFSASGLQPAPLPATLQIDPTTPTSCTPAGTKVTAVKIWENDRLAFYQDQQQSQTTPVTAAHVQRMADFYEAHGKPIIDQYFDGVSDIDGNGKVIVFISPVVGSGTAAFVWSGDFFTTASCPASNQGEYIYFSASLILAQDNADGANWQSLETLVHEMKHVSSLYKSIERPLSLADPYHPSWEEEGSAEIAGNLSNRVAWSTVGGPSVNTRVTDQLILDTGFEGNRGPIKPEFYGIALRMLRIQGFLSTQPNGIVVTPSGAGTAHTVYGSGWTFLRWLGDAYGNAASAPLADAPLFKTLNATATLPGIPGIEATVGQTFPRLLEQFAAAIMLHSTEAPEPARAFTSYDFVTSVEVFCFAADHPPCEGSPPGPTGSFPWPVTMTDNGIPTRSLQQNATFTGTIGPAGIRIHDFVSNGTGTGAELAITGDARSRIVVARIR